MKEPVPDQVDSSRADITVGDIAGALWRQLREMRTVFQLLVIIAVAAFLCAIIPQNAPPQTYYENYGRFLGNIITRLGLDHVHTAGWFIMLMGVLLLCLAACSRRLWVEAGARWRIPSAESAASRARGNSLLNAAVGGNPEQAIATVQTAARRRGVRVRAIGADGERRFAFAHKHRTSAWGQAMAHYAVFLIALGSILGSLPGISLDQTYDIHEGATLKGAEAELPFDVTVDHFKIDRDEATDAVKNYYTELRLMSGEEQVAQSTISVNRPLKYRGYFISQSSWGLGEARVEIVQKGKTFRVAYPLQRGASAEMGMATVWGVPREDGVIFLEDGQSAMVASGFYPDARREQKEIKPLSAEYPGTPALNLTLVGGLPSQNKPAGPPQGKPEHSLTELGWLLPGESKTVAGTSVKFVGITQTTGLGIRKDIGWPLVWLGFTALVLGMSLIFYLPLQRAIISFEPGEKGKTLVKIHPYRGEQTLGAQERQELWDDVLGHSKSV